MKGTMMATDLIKGLHLSMVAPAAQRSIGEGSA